MNNSFNSKCLFKNAPVAFYVVLTLLLLANGCATEPQRKIAPVPPKETEAITKPLETDAPDIPITELKLPETPVFSREQTRQHLEEIDRLIRSGESEQAKKLADAIDPSQLSDQEQSQLRLLYAQIDLNMGEAELALEHLKEIRPELLNLDQKINFLQAQAFAFSLSGRFLDSAKSRIELYPLLTSPESLDQNQRTILETLSLLGDQELENNLMASSGDMKGWLALARLYKLRDEPDFEARLGQWREAFPDHPANPQLLAKTAGSSESAVRFPGSIAVMLPGSGRYAESGRAVKAGLMAAFQNLKDTSRKPNLQFYDTTEAPPVELYRQAVAAGAEFIIGPLEKNDIQSLADSTSLAIPVLALNHIQNLEQDNLYQFALSPMDDVDQITGIARLDGHKNALLLLPENSQTQRIADFFKDFWPGDGRTLLKLQTYQPRNADFSSAIPLLLNRNAASTASVQPDQTTSTEKQASRPDADMIFIGAYGPEARTIKQQLNAAGAGELAVYALPNIYSGQLNPVEDQGLNGVTFCDMPWFFNTADQGNLGMSVLTSIWRQFPNSYLRLIAMGIDALNLSGRLNDLNSRPYPGATGKLSLAEDNRIKRELLCAKFVEGRPRIIDSMKQPGRNENDPSAAGGEPQQQNNTPHDPVQ